MATLGLALNKYYKSKDGSLRIRVSLYHNGETVYINTPYSLENEKQWSNGKVVRSTDASNINTRLRNLLNKYQDTLNELPNIQVLTAKQLKDLIVRRCNGKSSMTLHACACEYIKQCEKDRSTDYISMLELSLKYIDTCLGETTFISELSTSDVTTFKQWLKDNTNAGESTIGKYLSHFKVFINYAIRKQYVKYDLHPFATTQISKSAIKEDEDISLDSLLAIRNAVIDRKREIIARDMFMLSFYLGGINLVDILSSNLYKKDELEYVRQKIKSRSQIKVCLPITEQAKSLIDKYVNIRTGVLDFGLNSSYKTLRRYIDRGLKEIAKSLNISENLTFYSARKTFSQFAADLGVPNSVIDYCIGHSPKSNGVIAHYTKVRKQQAAIAIKRVIDYTENPEKYKEFIELKQDIMIAKL